MINNNTSKLACLTLVHSSPSTQYHVHDTRQSVVSLSRVSATITPCSALHRQQRAAMLAEHVQSQSTLGLYSRRSSLSLKVQRVTPRFAIHISLTQNLQLVRRAYKQRSANWCSISLNLLFGIGWSGTRSHDPSST